MPHGLPFRAAEQILVEHRDDLLVHASVILCAASWCQGAGGSEDVCTCGLRGWGGKCERRRHARCHPIRGSARPAQVSLGRHPRRPEPGGRAHLSAWRGATAGASLPARYLYRRRQPALGYRRRALLARIRLVAVFEEKLILPQSPELSALSPAEGLFPEVDLFPLHRLRPIGARLPRR